MEMVTYPEIWRSWADTLHRWGLQDIAAAALEGFAPLGFLGAQFIYLGQPFLDTFLPENQTLALAELLEHPEKTRSFVTFLKQDHRLE